jgi:ribose transport system substrate-binding protein
MLAAVQGAGLAGKVKMVGFDENEETLQGVKDGHIYGTIVQQPFEFGFNAVRIMAGLARGDRSVLPEGGILFIPHREITRDNVEVFWDELKRLKQG